MTNPPESTAQAVRTVRRAAFRDSFARPQESPEAAEHDQAVEAFIVQLQPLRRVPKGAA